MTLHEAALARIAKQPDAEALKWVYEGLIQEAEELDLDCNQVQMPFIEDGDEFKPGTWVPSFYFVVQKVLDDDSNQEGEANAD